MNDDTYPSPSPDLQGRHRSLGRMGDFRGLLKGQHQPEEVTSEQYHSCDNHQHEDDRVPAGRA